MTADLAAVCLTAPSGGRAGEFPDGSDRAGITGAGSFMVLTSKPGETSPPRVDCSYASSSCANVPDPPGGERNLPPVSQEKPMTVRERLGHLSNPSCASCRNLIDPISSGWRSSTRSPAHGKGPGDGSGAPWDRDKPFSVS